MNILKKFLVSIFILLFCFNSIGITNAISSENSYEKILIKDVIIKKQNLLEIKSGKEIVTKINSIIEKLKNNKEKLIEVQNKVWEMEDKYYDISQTDKGKKLFTVLEYLNAKINLALYEIRQKELEKYLKIKEKQEILMNEKLNEISNIDVSSEDIKKVENIIVKAQVNLVNNLEKNIKTLSDKFEKYASYEEKGNFNVNFLLDSENTGKIKANLDLNNYEYKNNLFDGQLKAKLNGLIEASKKGDEAFKVEFNSFVDYIQKDGNIYLLLKDLNIVDESNDARLKYFIEQIKNIYSKNEYIKIEDRDTKQILNFLKKLDISKLKSDYQNIVSKAFFTPYKKENNKYYLIPTKYACDTYKELTYRFDPFNGKTCSSEQYKNLLKELAKSGDLYIELGTTNKLIFEGYPKYDVKSFKTVLNFNDNDILSFNSKLEAIPEGEGFYIDYIKNKKLDFYFNADKNIIDLKATLNKENKFSTIDFIASGKNYSDNYNLKLKLENKKLTGGLTYSGKVYNGYDSTTGKSIYIPVKYYASINGTQDNNYDLKDFKLNYKQVRDDTKKPYFTLNFSKQNTDYNLMIISDSLRTGEKQFSTNIFLKSKNISGVTNLYIPNNKIKITHSGKYDKNYLEINNKIKLTKALSVMSYQGYVEDIKNSKVASDVRELVRVIEMGLVKGDFELKDIIKDGNKINYKILGINEKDFKQPDGKDYLIFINKDKYQVYGTTQENGKLIAIIRGTYYIEKKGDPQSLVKINGKIINNGDIVGSYKQEKEKSADGNVNLKFDFRYNRDNLDIHIDYFEDAKKIFEYNITNKATIDYSKNPTINAPENYIDQSKLY